MEMSTTIWFFAVLGFVSVFGGWGHYLSTIPRDVVPRTPTLMFVTQAAGLIFAIASIVFGLRVEVTPVGPMIFAVFAVFMGQFFFILFSLRKTPLGKLQAQVNAPMLAFETLDSTGTLVHSDDWRGRRILLKFFRGSW